MCRCCVAWLASLAEDAGGWLGALRDRHIGLALAAIHQFPERDWTVASLAAQTGLSRSPFSARFNALVGEPPLSYLTRWRMNTATRLLRETDLGLAGIAGRVGYTSEAAFSKAFTRRFKTAPGAYRRRYGR
ncbi:MAG: helix-turn-helix domain-containing protein [Gammaproteobacteria bacterium]